uniref:Uncharacterized protein n=1 Tax=Physcomitrium patens TaxID=3218 RepID=A0A2K1IPC9_PHYPA|nr:hypothetical protein PHYPA_027447 [Physcomitrium patens]
MGRFSGVKCERRCSIALVANFFFLIFRFCSEHFITAYFFFGGFIFELITNTGAVLGCSKSLEEQLQQHNGRHGAQND